jgi:hypothetical protein
MVSMGLPDQDTGLSRASVLTALGIFLLVSAVYALTGPGRIDIIDGQYRFEVAHNIVDHASIQIEDPFLGLAVPGLIGAYSPYGISGSLVAAPLVALGRLGASSLDREQFFFSFTSGVLGAATAALLFLFYTRLGVGRRAALFWTFVSAFATLAFPVATSVFDQGQHGFFALAAAFLAFASAKRRSVSLALAGGLAVAVLVNYQQTYVILIPTLGLAALAANDAESDGPSPSLERYLVFLFGGGLGLLFWFALNNFRFGHFFFMPGEGTVHPPVAGNPLIGLPALLFSPGKSIFLYSPPTILVLSGLRQLLRREPRLGASLIASSLAYLLMISSLSFYGGDWCWGPRYFASILPLSALGFPFVTMGIRIRRLAAGTLIGAGLAIQLLAISVDHHRYFYAHSLPTFFWYADRTYYFRHSALLARPGEVWSMIRNGVPSEAEMFRPGPYSGRLTYAVFGGWGHPELRPPAWMRHYSVFWLPRPWPMWMRAIPASERPTDITTSAFSLIAAVFGGTLICLRTRP